MLNHHNVQMWMSLKVPTLILLQGRQMVMARVWILHQNQGLDLGMNLSWIMTKEPAPPSFTSSYYLRGRDREDKECATQTEVKSPFKPSVCRTFPYISIMGST